jgi:hypothetical protein
MLSAIGVFALLAIAGAVIAMAANESCFQLFPKRGAHERAKVHKNA